MYIARAKSGSFEIVKSLGAIDPKEDMVGILMIQLLPYAHLNFRLEFQNAVTQAIVD